MECRLSQGLLEIELGRCRWRWRGDEEGWCRLQREGRHQGEKAAARAGRAKSERQQEPSRNAQGWIRGRYDTVSRGVLTLYSLGECFSDDSKFRRVMRMKKRRKGRQGSCLQCPSIPVSKEDVEASRPLDWGRIQGQLEPCSIAVRVRPIESLRRQIVQQVNCRCEGAKVMAAEGRRWM